MVRHRGHRELHAACRHDRASRLWHVKQLLHLNAPHVLWKSSLQAIPIEGEPRGWIPRGSGGAELDSLSQCFSTLLHIVHQTYWQCVV